MSAFYSIKQGGYPTPPGLAEMHDYFRTHQPAELLDDEKSMTVFIQIYGLDLALKSVQSRRVPENVTESWVLAGVHYKVGEDPVLVPIPAPGEPAWVARLEGKLDVLLARLAEISK